MTNLMFLSCIILLTVNCVKSDQTSNESEDIVHRMVRAAASPSKKQDCRYDKGAWEECDVSTGVQKRVFKLRPGQTPSSDCEAEKIQTRTCKKACRYAKGVWTDCVNGHRSRKDQLKGSAAGCEVERTITRKCKTVCKYSKAEFGPCDGQIKTKTLTLVEGNPSECESSKKITKICQTTGTTGRNTTTGGGTGRSRSRAKSS